MEMWVADAITNMFADATSSPWQAGQCYPMSGPSQPILTATDVRNVKPVDASYAWSLSGAGSEGCANDDHWRLYVPGCALRSHGGSDDDSSLLVPRLSVPRCRERHSEPCIRGIGRRGDGATARLFKRR